MYALATLQLNSLATFLIHQLKPDEQMDVGSMKMIPQMKEGEADLSSTKISRSTVASERNILRDVMDAWDA
jgi:molybdate-binding protein